MKFYFYPSDEQQFKESAVGNYVRTVVFDPLAGEITLSFKRNVHRLWEQTCKNNIETDHRIRTLPGDHYEVYSWVTQSSNELGLPGFA